MKKKRNVAVVAAVAVLALVMANPIYAAHLLGDSSVDTSGGVREIRWESYTKYGWARDHANWHWNQLGNVNIAPDAWYTATDLQWVDIDDCDKADGYWVPSGGWWPDEIQMNACHMDGAGPYGVEQVAVHELGHGLGIGDHQWWEYCNQDCIMYYCPRCTPYNTPQAEDRYDYYYLWP